MGKALAVLASVPLAAFLAGCSVGSGGDRDDAASSSPEAPVAAARACHDAGADAVLYTIGLSTDPYGRSSPAGFGVVRGLASGRPEPVEVRNAALGWFGGAEWRCPGQVLVPRRAPPFRRHLLYRYRDGALDRLGRSPVPRLQTGQRWSPDGSLVASETIAPCRPDQRTIFECSRLAGAVFVRRADGTGRRKLWDGTFDGWTPDGRLLVIDAEYRDGAYSALDVATGETSLPLSPKTMDAPGGARVQSLGPPRWSADGEYVAAYAAVPWPRRRVSGTLVVARADGRPVRFLTSPYLISMFAWSPVGHRLAYTTSGFPDPHELFVLDEPTAPARRAFVTGARHFDWIAWSPDARWLLLDDEHRRAWRLVPASGRGHVRTVRRLGGRPLWCCPVGSYATLND